MTDPKPYHVRAAPRGTAAPGAATVIHAMTAEAAAVQATLLAWSGHCQRAIDLIESPKLPSGEPGAKADYAKSWKALESRIKPATERVASAMEKAQRELHTWRGGEDRSQLKIFETTDPWVVTHATSVLRTNLLASLVGDELLKNLLAALYSGVQPLWNESWKEKAATASRRMRYVNQLTIKRSNLFMRELLADQRTIWWYLSGIHHAVERLCTATNDGFDDSLTDLRAVRADLERLANNPAGVTKAHVETVTKTARREIEQASSKVRDYWAMKAKFELSVRELERAPDTVAAKGRQHLFELRKRYAVYVVRTHHKGELVIPVVCRQLGKKRYRLEMRQVNPSPRSVVFPKPGPFAQLSGQQQAFLFGHKPSQVSAWGINLTIHLIYYPWPPFVPYDNWSQVPPIPRSVRIRYQRTRTAWRLVRGEVVSEPSKPDDLRLLYCLATESDWWPTERKTMALPRVKKTLDLPDTALHTTQVPLGLQVRNRLWKEIGSSLLFDLIKLEFHSGLGVKRAR